MKRRNTMQRDLVLEAVRSLQDHATADEVYAHILKSHPMIGKGTVYRNLNILSDGGEIMKVEVPDGPDRFDHNCKKHYHMECISCGDVVDVHMNHLPDIEECLSDKQDYEILSYDIMFKGLCPNCQEMAVDKVSNE